MQKKTTYSLESHLVALTIGATELILPGQDNGDGPSPFFSSLVARGAPSHSYAPPAPPPLLYLLYKTCIRTQKERSWFSVRRDLLRRRGRRGIPRRHRVHALVSLKERMDRGQIRAWVERGRSEETTMDTLRMGGDKKGRGIPGMFACPFHDV